jgi:predicted dienelactone hydrolase
MKKHLTVLFTVLAIGLGVFACGPQQEQPSKIPQVTSTTKQATATPPPQITDSPKQHTATSPPQIKEPVSFPLSEPGAYLAGYRSYTVVDESRNNREIKLLIWYPALKQVDANGRPVVRDAPPDVSVGPYPVIVSSYKLGNHGFGPHMASHGFVIIGVRNQDAESHWGAWLINFPLEQAAALDRVVENPPEGFEGMFDTERAGAMGYSFGGYNALALGGARVDPEYYLSQCAAAVPRDPAPEQWWINYICNLDGGWDDFVANAGPGITESADGLWQPLTDPRIKAVMPMGPEGAWLFGERGLAAVDGAVLIIAGTADDLNYYDLEATYIYEHIGTPDKAMISFIDQGHMMIFNDETRGIMMHFATAFFGYYLQGREKYAEYFSEDFVTQFDDLAWGVYSDE